MDGRKDDEGKTDWLILIEGFQDQLEEVVKVLKFGEEKYGRNNWSSLDNLRTRYLNAACRHLLKEISDEDGLDRDTGCSHLAHLICCALFLMNDAAHLIHISNFKKKTCTKVEDNNGKKD